MRLFPFFNTKGATVQPLPSVDARTDVKNEDGHTVLFDAIVQPHVVGTNFLEMFRTIPEVFFPIDYIASRVSGANFIVKREKDDSINWRQKEMNAILSKPNCVESWKEFVYNHFVHKLATGTSFVRAAMNEIGEELDKFAWCSNFWVLPSAATEAVRKWDVPLFGVADLEDYVDCFAVKWWDTSLLRVPTWQVFVDRDGLVHYHGLEFLKGTSRLLSLRKPISNLLAVYEARNVIYVKRGGIGYLVSQKKDATGSVPLTDVEKRELLKQNYEKYGVGPNQVPYGISDVPLTFVRTNLSISDLQPFEETLQDAITIAGAYGIPSVLVPRKDQSTFANQATAEKTVYSSVVIPMCKQFCKDMTHFLGLDHKGMYLDCDFSDVDCLQAGMKEKEEVKKLVNDRCLIQFDRGMITLNDWRAQIGESQIPEEENPLFSKLKFNMSDEELAQITRIINNQNQQTDDREDDESRLSDEGL